MMYYYAQLNGGVVVAITETYGPINAPDVVQIASFDSSFDSSLIGCTYVDGVFVPPAPVVPAEPEWAWYIDIGPFFDRFGVAKMAVLTSADVGVQAILKDIQVRKWIDLMLPEVAQSLAYVGTKVPAVTPALQSAILTTKPALVENLALRKLYFA